MVLNILGVFEAEELYSDTYFDRRTAEWKLIKALNENGLYRDGLTSNEIQEIVTKITQNMQISNMQIKKMILLNLQNNGLMKMFLLYYAWDTMHITDIGLSQLDMLSTKRTN